ncbi:hypothetical protein [Halalkalicoccus salilacus]
MIGQVEEEVALIERHLDILRRVIENEPIGIMKLANEGGYEHHEVRYSLRVLEEDGIIKPSNHGAITTERTEEFVSGLDERLATLADRFDAMKIEERADGNH